MKKTKKQSENTFFQITGSIAKMARWWKHKNSTIEKRGSFNVEHYLKVQNARFE